MLFHVVKDLVVLYMWVIAPIVLGNFWLEKGRKIAERFIFTYLMGMVSEWAAFFAAAKWAIAREMTLQELGRIWLVTLGLLTAAALVWGAKQQHFSMPKQATAKKGMMTGLLAFVLLAVMCTVCGGQNQEEATLESVLTMSATDTLYQYDPATGKETAQMMSFEIEAMENAAKSPIEAYYALGSFISERNPIKFVRVLLPFFLMPLYFGTYQLWARTLFAENRAKWIVFQITVWLLYASALISERAVWYSVFSNCWNGETLFFAGLLPWAVWLLLQESRKEAWIAQYAVCALAGQLLYTKGAFVVSFLWGVVLCAKGIKRWKDDSSV